MHSEILRIREVQWKSYSSDVTDRLTHDASQGFHHAQRHLKGSKVACQSFETEEVLWVEIGNQSGAEVTCRFWGYFSKSWRAIRIPQRPHPAGRLYVDFLPDPGWTGRPALLHTPAGFQ